MSRSYDPLVNAVGKPLATFMRSLDEKTMRFIDDYRAEHHDDDPAEVDAYCRGFLEANSMWIAITIMRNAQ